jgi:hypothetical protein
MYPEEELENLRLRKLALVARIGVQRLQYNAAAARLAAPLALIDRIITQWRRISPLVKLGAIPVLFLFKRMLFPGGRAISTISKVFRWGPLVFGAFRAYKSMRSSPTQ